MFINLMALVAASIAAAGEPSMTPAPTTPTPAATAVATATTTTETGVTKPGDKVVCKTIIPTGSRLGGERICKTRDEWLEITRYTQHVVGKAQLGGSMAREPGN